MMNSSMHIYTHAIVGIRDPIPGPDYEDDCENIDVEALRHEFDGFKRCLQELNLNVIEIDTKGSLRDKLLMEDMAIVCQGIAILPKHTNSMYKTYNSELLRKTLMEWGMKVIVQDPHSTADFTPADVLFTGREFFVGISDHTSETGAIFIAETFPEFPCTPIRMPPRSFPLKRYITVAGRDILTVCGNDVGQELIRKIEREANYTYQTLTIPDMDAVNCIYVNDVLLHKGIEDMSNACFKVFCDKIDFPRRSLKFTELSKLRLGPNSCTLLLKLI